MTNLESPSAALCAATPPLAPLDPRFYELLGKLKTWSDEDRTSARNLSAEAVRQANYCAFARAAVLAHEAALSEARAEGLNLAAIELRDLLAILAAERGDA